MIIVWICNSYKGHSGSFHLWGQIAYEAFDLRSIVPAEQIFATIAVETHLYNMCYAVFNYTSLTGG